MKAVVHVIAIIAVDDVYVIRVAPADWPRIDKSERIATIPEAPVVVVAPVDMEAVLTAESAGVVRIGNASMLTVIPALCRGWRMLGASMVLLCAVFGPIGRHSLRCRHCV